MIAYELREAFAGTVEQPDPDFKRDPENPDAPVPTIEVPYFTGGLIRAGDRDINVREELDANDGRILVPDHDVSAIVVLDGYAPLKRVDVDESDATLAEQPVADRFTLQTLRKDPRLADVAGASSARKDDLVTALDELDRRRGEGDLAAPLETLSVTTLVAAANARTAPTPDTED